MLKQLSDKKICVAVLLDAYQVSGSAKVVIQNLKFLPADLTAFLILFRRGEKNSSELELKLKESGINFEIVTEACAFDPRVIFKIVQILRSKGVQIIESNHYKTHLIALIVSTLLRLPWIAVSHGWTSENFKMRLYNTLDRFTLPWATACVSTGPTIATEIQSMLLGGKKATCLPTALDPSELKEAQTGRDLRSELGINKDLFIFGAIGRLSFEKGFDVLLNACSLLAKSGLDFKVLLIGSGHEESKLLAQVKELNISDKIIFLGQKLAEELALYYRIFDSLIIPSRSEGMPNVLLEAAWFKVPVIATKVGGIPQLMHSNLSSWLCESEDAQSMFVLMKEMIALSQFERENIFKDLNIRLKKNYLAEHRTKKVYRLYRAVMKVFHQ